MNDIANIDLTISSREIAELVVSHHDKVKWAIDRLVVVGAINLLPLEEGKAITGNKLTNYMVGKRDSYVSVAQLSPEQMARLVDCSGSCKSLIPRASH